MPRKKNKVKRPDVQSDYKYGSIMVTKIINQIMEDGKKSIATDIVYKAMGMLAESTGDAPLEALEKSMANIMPPVEVRSRRVGGATYQVPVDVRPARQNSLSVRWLVTIARKRKEHSMDEKLGKELIDAFNNTGACIKKKTETIKMADANKAFAHYRW